jgi:deoxyribodipyrimidine photo-lyase
MTFQPPLSFAGCRALSEKPAADPFALRVHRAGGEEATRGSFVLYWAQAARRLRSNIALDYAIARANALGLPVVVFESLRADYPSANDRIHSFVLQGVEANRRDAAERGLRYLFLLPRNREEARGALRRVAAEARLIVTDEHPAFIYTAQTSRFASRAKVPLFTVDGNGMLPMRGMPGEQYSARFFRQRAHRLFEQFWTIPPDLTCDAAPYAGPLDAEDWDGDVALGVGRCAIDHRVPPLRSRGGRDEALRRLERFIAARLAGYADGRNREAARTSELSPYLHFGYIGIHEVAARVLASDAPQRDVDSYLEEAVIRRELSFNMCHFRPDYDSLRALPDWAADTLHRHRQDRRRPLYSQEELEQAATGDEVWNLSQRGLLETGTIHNYLRMLWGKKIIEWSETPEEAHRTMLQLHEKWAIDGRDPNTHAGVLWCFGKHDRPWAPERPIFGTVRYMSSDSTRRKVDLAAYARKIAEEGCGITAPARALPLFPRPASPL